MKLGSIVLGLLGLVHASTAQADSYEFSRLALLGSGCKVVGLESADLRAAVASELSASSLELAPIGQASASTDVVVNLRAPCAPGEALILIATWHGNSFERAVKLDELPRASRERALALIVAELLAQFAKSDFLGRDVPAQGAATTPAATANPTPELIDLPETPASPSASPSAMPPRPRPKAALDETRRPRPAPERRAPREAESSYLGGALELRSFLGGPSLFGGRLHVDFGSFALGLSAVGSDHTVTAGVLSAIILHGTVAVRAVRLDTSARTSLSLGPRIGLGYVTVSARTASPNVEAVGYSEPYVDGAAFAAFALRPSASLRCGVALELGYARGVVALADTIDVGHYGGLFASALVDLAFEL